jgi:hypothetical protein
MSRDIDGNWMGTPDLSLCRYERQEEQLEEAVRDMMD